MPQLATCVWVGYPSGEIPLLNVEGVAEVFGGTLPAEIWHDFMGPAVANLPVENFPTPSVRRHADQRRRHVLLLAVPLEHQVTLSASRGRTPPWPPIR